MRYLTDFTDSQVAEFLELSSESGVKNLLDISHLVQALSGNEGPDGRRVPSPFNKSAATLMRRLEAVIHKFKDHPGLLGWYVCDDCMTQWLIAYLNANKTQPPLPGLLSPRTLYEYIKRLDPYHPIVGASESANVYTFTMANEFIPGGPSLDVVMVENYYSDLSENAHVGDHTSPGMDGSFAAWPLTFEPIVNCPGIWLVGNRSDISWEEKARQMYSFSWLSAVLAGMTSQLHFRLFPFGKNIYMPPALQEYMIGGVGRYQNVAGSQPVSDFLNAPPSGVREPFIENKGECEVCAAVWRKDMSIACNIMVTFVV